MLLSTKLIIKMSLYLFYQIIFILIFNTGLSVSKIIIMDTQPLLHERANRSISISCPVSMSCSSGSFSVLWYVFKTDSYYQLDINSQQHKYKLVCADLQINLLSPNDDGVYYCAVILNSDTQSGAQAFGNGTTLVVKESDDIAWQALLFTLVGILSLYSLTILTLIICIKIGRATSFLQGRLRRSQVKNDSSRRDHFGAVVQEMYSKRNLRRIKKNSEVSQENKVKNPQSDAEREDVYQNVKMA